MSIPKYKISIDDEFSDGEDLGMNKIAFTNRPAIIVKGMAFNSDGQEKELFFADKVKYRIAAPAMIPMQIYRNQDNEEFYVEFTEQEIEKIHSKFMKKFSSNKNIFNLEHNNEETVPAYILECWLVENPEKDKSFSSYGIKVPKGTLFVVAQITDKEYYNQLVENNQTGFSIEGFLGLSLSDLEQKQKFSNKINTNMEDSKTILPEGAKFQVGDKWYEVKDGVVIESVAEEVAEEVAMAEEEPATEDEVKEEVVEEVKAEENVAPAEEEKKEEEVEMAEGDAPDDATSVSYTKEEVDAKFEELYKMIADMQTEEVVEEVKEEMMNSNVALSVQDRLEAFIRFSKKK